MLKNEPRKFVFVRPLGPARRRLNVALLLCALAAPGLFGCAPQKQAKALALPPPGLSCALPNTRIGKLDDPNHVFCSRAPNMTTITVTATAYLARGGKRKRASRGAWGDELDPDANIVAVSPDLDALGLTRGAKLRIEGLDGEFVVLDRMHPRVRKTIDIYFGHDRAAARQWGRRSLTISFEQAPDAPAQASNTP